MDIQFPCTENGRNQEQQRNQDHGTAYTEQTGYKTSNTADTYQHYNHKMLPITLVLISAYTPEIIPHTI
jgi:hypothetical protein